LLTQIGEDIPLCKQMTPGGVGWLLQQTEVCLARLNSERRHRSSRKRKLDQVQPDVEMPVSLDTPENTNVEVISNTTTSTSTSTITTGITSTFNTQNFFESL